MKSKKKTQLLKKKQQQVVSFFIDISDYAGAFVDTRKNTFPNENVSAERVFSALAPFF